MNVLTIRNFRSVGLDRVLLFVFGAGLIIPAFYLLVHDQLRLLIALFFVTGLIILWHVNRSLAICINFCYLFLLGDIRRYMNVYIPAGGLDPLLVVGALSALYIGLPLFRSVRVTDVLSKSMLGLLGIMILEIFNPKQGSLLVGFSAGLFYVVPVIWFWIGRAYATEELCGQLLYRVVVPLGLLAAALGLYQTFVGFLPWEQAWIDASRAAGFDALFLHADQARAFGFSVNSTEFAGLLQVTTILLGAAVSGKRWWYLLPIPMLLASTFFGGSRGPIVRIVFGMATVWAIRGYARGKASLLPRIVFATAVGFGALYYSVSQVSENAPGLSSQSTTSDAATAHQIQGLADPFNAQSSTAGIHVAIVQQGILAGFTNPVGYGLGAATLAAGKFNVGTGALSSEVDFSDAFVTMGLPGGLCFLAIVVFSFQYVLKYTRSAPKGLAFGLFGMLAACFGAWLPQGQYGMAPLMLFCIGFLTKQRLDREAVKESQEASWTVSSSGLMENPSL